MPPATFRRAAVAAALVLLGAGSGAAAQSASASGATQYSVVRLIDGGHGAPGALRAGVEIKLAPGWKTYWRYPGDSGVPPRFDFSGSDNVAAVDVRWPAPMRFTDPGGVSIGYAKDVVLPLHVAAQDKTRPVTLRATIEYAICEKVCIPMEAKLALRLGAQAAFVPALETSERHVPQRMEVGADGPLAIAAVRQEGARVVVDVKAPSGEPVDLFAEGPDDAWSLPLPSPVKDAPEGIRRFAFALDGAPPGKSFVGVPLRLTAVTPQAAIETELRLD